MTAPSLATLVIRTGKELVYQTALSIANTVGLNTTSWRAGDPTRSLYHLEAEILGGPLEDMVVGFIESDFLDLATGMWLKLTAKQKYNVDVPDPTYAITDVVITNDAGGVYDVDPGDVTLKNTLTGKTYHNTTGGHLDGWSGSGTKPTLAITVEADEPGSESSAGAGDIDALVTTNLQNVTVTNPTAAIGVDEQEDQTTRQQCRDSLGPMSPNGPRDAYRYVARNPALTGVGSVQRCRVFGRSTTGRVRVYIAGANGPVTEADRLAVEAAIVRYAMGITQTPAVIAASPVVVDITYQLWVYKSVNKTEAQVLAAVETRLEQLFLRKEIGGDLLVQSDPIGRFAKSEIETAIDFADQVFKVVVSLPTTDLGLANNEFAVLGTVTGVVSFADDP